MAPCRSWRFWYSALVLKRFSFTSCTAAVSPAACFQPYIARGQLMAQAERRARWVWARRVRTNIHIYRDEIYLLEYWNEILNESKQKLPKRWSVHYWHMESSLRSTKYDLSSQTKRFTYDILHAIPAMKYVRVTQINCEWHQQYCSADFNYTMAANHIFRYKYSANYIGVSSTTV